MKSLYFIFIRFLKQQISYLLISNFIITTEEIKMGCLESKAKGDSNPRVKKQKQFFIQSQNMNPQLKQKNNLNTFQKHPILNISDYDGFIAQSRVQDRTAYPTTFQFIKIVPVQNSKLNAISKEDISPLNCTRNQLIEAATLMIRQNTFAQNNLNGENLKSLITVIASNYNSVSYHNFSHGFSLMQMIYKCFKLDENLRKFYNDQQLTYYYIAGLTHDVNHPGTNNLFEIKLKTKLAQTANNQSVLEKMHLQTFLDIVRSKPEFDVFSKSTNVKLTKQKITRAIIATDMAKHFTNLSKLTKARQQGYLNFNDEQIKIVFMQNLVHAADIGNGLLPFEEYLNWGSLLAYEFNQQTKLQAQNNVQVTGFLVYKNHNSFLDDQIGFLGKFVLPLWKQIGTTFTKITPLLKNCEENLSKIKEMKQKNNQ